MQAFFTKHTLLIFGLILLFAYSSAVSGERQPTPPTSPAPSFVVRGETPTVSATAYAVFAVATGEVFVSQNTEAVLPIASITKLATAAAVLSGESLDREVVVQEVDVAAVGRAGKLAQGERYTQRELLFPLLLESSNDAAAALRRSSSFDLVSEMNDLAVEAEMRNTYFADTSGLSDRNVSTVADLQLFLRYLAEEQPHVLDITRLKSYVGTYSSLLNNSPVIQGEYEGGKHGFTEAAGRTMVALFAEQIGGTMHTVGYVLLGSADLRADTATLRAFVRDSVRFE